jgi:folylpolyglutamate synthase/dihydropteroate synthase
MALETRIVGAHQADNLRTALAALLAFEERAGRQLDPARVADGIRAARWPGRFEVVSTRPVVVVDGAHCPLSGAALGAAFRECYGRRPVVAVAGFMRDKAAEEITRAALGSWNVAAAVACAAPSPRGQSAAETAAILRRATCAPVVEEAGVADAVRRAMGLLPPDGAVVVFGSLFLVAGATEAVRQMRVNRQDTRDTK